MWGWFRRISLIQNGVANGDGAWNLPKSKKEEKKLKKIFLKIIYNI